LSRCHGCRDRYRRGGGDRRYSQRLLRPGEDVYVFETVQRRVGASSARNPENLVVKRVPERDHDLEPLFLIADRPEVKLRASRTYALLWFPVGALLTTAGLGGLAVVGGSLLGVDIGVP
jgi:hypothetical protein